jgi:hypothetical protein
VFGTNKCGTIPPRLVTSIMGGRRNHADSIISLKETIRKRQSRKC